MSKEWVCFIYSNEVCKDAHWRGQQPNWKGEHPYPKGHDRCGWVEIPETADKAFADDDA